MPNLTLGAPIVKALRAHTSVYLDCHLMVTHPMQWVDDFAAAGASGFTFHIEAVGAFHHPPLSYRSGCMAWATVLPDSAM